MTAFLLDMTEKWDFPLASVGFLLLVIVIVLRSVRRWEFFAFLVLSTIHILLSEFPDVGNHNNLTIICNLLLMTGIIHAGVQSRSDKDDDGVFELLMPPLRIILSLVYFFAGFHKLNSDFFHPDVSCGIGFFEGVLDLLHLPDLVLPQNILFIIPLFVLIWELGGGLALWSRKLQAPMLLVSWMMHAILAQMVFFDFSSMAFALLLTFLPHPYWDLIMGKSAVQWGSLRLQRAHVYFWCNVVVAIVAGFYFWQNGYQPAFHRWQGLALNIGFLLVIWPLLWHIAKKLPSFQWPGVPMWNRQASGWWVLFPIFVFFYALNPYFGLRTAGTFTMFSNLRTEGETSNHLLLGSNPLKRWTYQEDVVEIIELDPRHTRNPDRSLSGYLLPVVEFKKQIYQWRTQGMHNMYATFRYHGHTYSVQDISTENPWNVASRDLEMFLLDFRVIQTNPTPNACRW
ncbi:hypothetical protein KFU94_40330 [Chloroflexi bacterium TSY]|nr:hypothetical protein [Chloroflexi bacterium TSY]